MKLDSVNQIKESQIGGRLLNYKEEWRKIEGEELIKEGI
jgi:hypothetical protein